MPGFIFISDMYLPTAFIQATLVRHGLAQPSRSGLRLGDIGLTKASGNLFHHILQQEGLKPSQLYHRGDNIHSDVQVPKRLGITATHVSDPSLNRYERQTLQSQADHRLERSQMAAISRATRLGVSTKAPVSPALTELIASVVAPFLTRYVAWVLRDAQSRGLKRLYFVARDGQILLKIAEILAQKMAAPECRYLYGSRQAWFLPSVTAINPQALDWLVLPGHSQVLRHLLQRLTLTPEEIATALCAQQLPPSSWEHPLDTEGIERLWQVLTSPEVSDLIVQKAATARQHTQHYLRQAGLLADQDWAIVDIGWTLKCQRALKTILQDADVKSDVRGYYLGVLRERLPMAVAGDYRAWLIQADSQRLPITTQCIFQRMNVVEQVFMMADHQTTTGYGLQGDRVEPIFKSGPFSSERIAYVEHLHGVVQRYAQTMVDTDLLSQDVPAIDQWTITNLVTLLTQPQRHEVRAIADLKVGDDQNESRAQPIARPVKIQDIVYFARRLSGLARSRDYGDGFTWLEGGVQLSNPCVQLAYRMALALQAVIRHQEPIWLYRGLHQLRSSLRNRRIG
jgi:hypothetical protein